MGLFQDQILADLAKSLQSQRLTDLMHTSFDWVHRRTVDAAGIHVDWSKHFVSDKVLGRFEQLLGQITLADQVRAYLAGEWLNPTEQCGVGHMGLRVPPSGAFQVLGKDVMPAMREAAVQCDALVAAIQHDRWCYPVRDVVHIGVGGSHWGPALLYQVCEPLITAKHRTHFYASADPKALQQLLAPLDPRHTLFVFVSKSMTTDEVLVAYEAVQAWLGGVVQDAASHCLAVTACQEKALALGFAASHILPIWSWVGGRFSVWSSVSLVVMLAAGMPVFREFLAGARAMDQHFATAPYTQNMPVMLACLTLYYQSHFHVPSHCMVAYDAAMGAFLPYVQQLRMESNGKSVSMDGTLLTTPTGTLVWGGLGTAAQHGYCQWLHQGQCMTPVDFIVAAADIHGDSSIQRPLLSHCLAQSAALLQGDADAQTPAQSIPGNRPSTTLLLSRLNPNCLGALLALYEHQTFVESVCMGVNAFDQWGVALGKRHYRAMQQCLQTDGQSDAYDPSTRDLLRHVHSAAEVDDEVSV